MHFNLLLWNRDVFALETLLSDYFLISSHCNNCLSRARGFISLIYQINCEKLFTLDGIVDVLTLKCMAWVNLTRRCISVALYGLKMGFPGLSSLYSHVFNQ